MVPRCGDGKPGLYLIEGVRSPIIIGWDAEALTLAFVIAGTVAAVAVAAASWALKARLAAS